MKKQLLLNAAGVAVLSLMCACGPLADKKEEETKKEALAEIPESVQAAANEALAQVETPEEGMPGEEEMPGEEAEKASKVAMEEPTEEPVEQKA